MISAITIIIVCISLVGGYSYETLGKNNAKPLDTIRMAVIIFRHGERNPDSSYPTDPYINYTWPGGYGALLPKGALNLFNVGKKLRARYSKLIPKHGLYDKDVVNVQSSQYERCLMSGESFLAGFMPPKKCANILPIAWQPIPIYSLPINQDYYIFQLAPCPVYDQIYKSFTSPENVYFNETYAPYVEVLQMLTYYTGKPITTALNVEGLYGTLAIQKDTGLKLPKWTEQFYPEPIIEIVKMSSRLNTYTTWMKKIKGGPLITRILDYMNGKRLKTLDPNRSLFIYSGHDITLKNVLNTIGVMSQTGEIPDFGATLVFELHANESLGDDDFEIRIVYYSDGYKKIPINVKIPNCPKPCSLINFTESMSPYIIRNIEEICAP